MERRGWLRAIGAVAAGLWIFLVGLRGPSLAPADETAPPPPPPSGTAKPVDLERLLKLPASVEYDVEKKGGATKTEWRARFQQARDEVQKARASLDKAEKALETGAEKSPWSVAPPGVQATTQTESTANFSLSQEVKHQREEVKRTEKHLRDLEVEANLAGVPPDWRE
ncbi:MAG TPA: hypothetical protein VEG67_01015 [Myxococcota bacterium]|nr:hypothetical protein [Myxococcota bacterium]